MFLLITVAVIALSATYLWLKSARPNNLPPGPTGLPFVGSILSLGSNKHVTILKWKEKYGDTFSFSDGVRWIVVVSEFHTLRKVLGDEATTGRIRQTLMRGEDSSLPISSGLLGSHGPLWKTHRRFALSTLRDLGMGKNWLEDSISQEVAGLIQVLKDTHKQPFNPKAMLTNSVSNVICALTFGKRFPLDDPKFSKFTAMVAEDAKISKKISETKQNSTDLANFFREIIAEHRAASDQSVEVENHVSAYEKEKHNGTKTDLKTSFDDRQLIGSPYDLFAAGTETTSTTTLWAMVFMIEHPNIMKKVQDEIDSIVGREHMLNNADRAMLPYTEAVILEVQRAASLVPLGIPHFVHDEMTIDEYTLPKGTMIAPNFFSIHRDARYWNEPLVFNPGRFLDENQKLLKPDGFAPFSIDKRVCLGESLAKMELFLFIANILWVFTLGLPPGKILPREDYHASMVSSPNPFELIFVPRN